MKIEEKTLVLVKRPVDTLDIGIVNKIHSTAPIFEIKTLLSEKPIRCYECNLIALTKMPPEAKDIEEAVKNLFPRPELCLLEKIKTREKFTKLEIKVIEEIFSIDPSEEPVDDF